MVVYYLILINSKGDASKLEDRIFVKISEKAQGTSNKTEVSSNLTKKKCKVMQPRLPNQNNKKLKVLRPQPDEPINPVENSAESQNDIESENIKTEIKERPLEKMTENQNVIYKEKVENNTKGLLDNESEKYSQNIALQSLVPIKKEIENYICGLSENEKSVDIVKENHETSENGIDETFESEKNQTNHRNDQERASGRRSCRKDKSDNSKFSIEN